MLAIAAMASFTAADAQKKLNEGKVVFEISYPGMQLDPQQAAMLPSESVTYVKNGKSRTEQKMGMGMNQVMITDAVAKTAVTLVDMMGNKTAIKTSKEDMEKEEAKAEKPTVKLLDETKEIAGYKCKKAEITDAKGNKTTLFYTKDIEAARGGKGPFAGIDGFPMEFEMKQPSMSIKLTATKVVEEKVDDVMFSVPSGYKEMTMEEYKKQMGGAMGK